LLIDYYSINKLIITKEKMKKLMLTTALASVLTTAAIAQTTVTGEIRVSYSDITMKKGALGTTDGSGGSTADTSYGFGVEQQLNIQNKGKLNFGGLDYAAGFSIENDGNQTGTIFNENTYIDISNASSGTTLSFSRDHIQRSDTDFSATNLVGFTPNELSQTSGVTNNGTRFKQAIGAAPGQGFGAAIVQKTPVGSFSYLYVPNNAGNGDQGAVVTNNGLGGSEDVAPNTTSAYEYGFVGDFGVKGLQAHYFKNKNDDVVTVANTVSAEAKNYGIKYNFGQVTVAANKKKHQQETLVSSVTSGVQSEITETAFAAAYAVNKDITIGLLMAKAERDNSTVDQKIKAINVGYALGPVDLSIGYGKNKDQGGVVGADTDHVIERLIGKF
jgi:hypothetical protein